MIVDLVLTNAKAYLRKEICDCCLAIEDGAILKIGRETQMPKADERIDLRNLLVLPGLIDVHVHLRDEGKAYKEDFYTGTAAAAAGGFTTVLDMPNNDPVTMSSETLRERMHIAGKKILVNVGFYSEFPRKLEQVKDIVAEGALAFKLFMAHQVGGLNINDDVALREAFSRVGKENVPVAVHAEDCTMISANEHALKATKRDDAAAFLKAHAEEAELKAIEHILETTSETGAHLHFCHLTTRKGLDSIVEAKRTQRALTCEVTPNHLFLSDVDFRRHGSMLAMMPPLRSSTNVEALWQGIAKGSVDVVGSDHAPHTFEEKSTGNIWDAKVGVPGLETTLPLMLTSIKKGRLTLDALVCLLAEKPAEIFNLKGRGTLRQGEKADLVVIDLKPRFKIDSSKFHSKAKYSPYEGWEVQGRPVKTFINGHLVMDDQEIIARSGSGAVIRGDYS